MTYCETCKRQVDARWKFSRERCPICGNGLDKDPIKIDFYEPFDRLENNRKAIESILKDGTISKEDLR